MASVFVASIEGADGVVRQHGYHLGTIESVARTCAVEIFRREQATTVALKRDGVIWDVYDGSGWHTDQIAAFLDADLNGGPDDLSEEG